MAYIDFKHDVIVVLNKYEAVAFIDAYMMKNGTERMEEDTFEDILGYGIDSAWLTPLKDDVFKHWSIEPIGNIKTYDVSTLSSGDNDLFFVSFRPDWKSTECLKRMFNDIWLAHRKYELRYVWA